MIFKNSPCLELYFRHRKHFQQLFSLACMWGVATNNIQLCSSFSSLLGIFPFGSAQPQFLRSPYCQPVNSFYFKALGSSGLAVCLHHLSATVVCEGLQLLHQHLGFLWMCWKYLLPVRPTSRGHLSALAAFCVGLAHPVMIRQPTTRFCYPM